MKFLKHAPHLSKSSNLFAIVCQVLLYLCTMVSCQSKTKILTHQVATMAHQAQEFKVLMALTPEEHTNGLSGVRGQDWPDNQGMLESQWLFAVG